jgi:hypothetical protein
MKNTPSMQAVPCAADCCSADDLKWFAGMAMQGMIAKQGIPDSPSAREEIALWAYRMAESMNRTRDRLHCRNADTHTRD